VFRSQTDVARVPCFTTPTDEELLAGAAILRRLIRSHLAGGDHPAVDNDVDLSERSISGVP